MNNNTFKSRHIGPRYSDLNEMLKTVNAETLDKLIEETVPESIRLDRPLDLGKPASEFEFLSDLRKLASKNRLFKNYIGLGYNPAILPPVIQRNIFENPGWYTQYTPYQAEISQGRLEALLNFQTMITDMTGLHVANASLLDEGTAAAEAVLMARSIRKGDKINSNKIFISEFCFPQTIDVVKTRAIPLGIEVVTGNHENFELTNEYFAVIVQYPACDGEIFDYTEF
ncbi:MAG: glycine dehydrogenase (aminomethyl-transferring), partial [Ignavibacteria bacterium]|nr:glycine dehydrogenase (aminomethyl-transferring) [Ignavibacteria bacterium]